ncbi:hypothetical protein ABFA07_018876 [Porites harrisoni]
MASFREARIALLDAYMDGLLDDDEFLVLWQAHKSKKPEFPYEEHGRFSFDELDEAECKAEFRFKKRDLPVLVNVLGIPNQFTCSQRTVRDGMEGLCMVLRRMAYPCRYSNLIPRFGRPVPVLSMICNRVIDYIYDLHVHRLTSWNPQLLDPASLQMYCDAISRNGSPLDNCFGFIDGTVRPVCRPGEQQRVLYNGHKRMHALKFQSVVLPSGMIAHMYGPVEGRKHDAGMLADSGLLADLQRNAFSLTGQPLCLYGDPAYPLRIHLQCPFRNAVLTPQMQEFNAAMSALRISVEWLFGDIINYFKFLDFKNNLKVGLSSVGKMYLVGAIIRNAHTCLYHNQTSDFFSVDPPTLQDYFV